MFSTAIALQICTPLARATGAHPDAIVGYWQGGEGEAVVEIRRRADHYHGVIVASERRPETIGTENLQIAEVRPRTSLLARPSLLDGARPRVLDRDDAS